MEKNPYQSPASDASNKPRPLIVPLLTWTMKVVIVLFIVFVAILLGPNPGEWSKRGQWFFWHTFGIGSPP